MGSYASQNEPAAAVRLFLKAFPSLNERTVRCFRKRYDASLKIAARDNISPPKAIVNIKRGRALMLCQLAKLIQRFLQATRYKGGVVSS